MQMRFKNILEHSNAFCLASICYTTPYFDQVNIWLDGAEKAVNEMEALPTEDILAPQQIDSLKLLTMEMSQVSPHADEARDMAILLLKCGVKYSKTVEPELTRLNRRWQTVHSKLQSLQALQGNLGGEVYNAL